MISSLEKMRSPSTRNSSPETSEVEWRKAESDGNRRKFL
jgi:hypothetical protein